jgi:hypothetical protein
MHIVLALSFCLALLAPVNDASWPTTQRQDIDWYGGAAGHGPTGAPVDGFALSLTRQQSSVHLGGPIWVAVEVRNVSGKMQDAWFGSRHSSYAFMVVNRDSKAIMPRKHNTFGLVTFSGPPNGHPVYPGDSLYGQFRLDLLYDITAPGTYSIQVSDGRPAINGKALHLQSNTITITILP